jgi:MFS family permease
MTADPAPHSQRRIVLTFSLAVFLFTLSGWVVAVYLPIYLEKVLHLSRSSIGLLISIYTVTLIVLVAPFGHLSDRVSPKRIIQAGMLLFGSYCFLMAGVQNLPFLAGAQVVGGTGNSLVIIALPSLYYKHLTLSRKGQKVGLYMFGTFLGFAVGPLVSGFLLEQWGLSYRAIFLLAGCMVGVLLLFSSVLKDSRPFRIRLLEYKEDIFRKEVFLLVCMLVAMGIHYGNERASFSLYMRNVVGLDNLGIGVMAVAAGALFDRTKKLLLFVCGGMILSGVAHMATAYTENYASVLLARILHTTGDSIVIFSMNAIIAFIFPAKRMGGNYGFTAFFKMQGAFLGALMSGFLDNYCGYRASFIVAGSCTILVGLLLAANWRAMLKLSKQLSK